MRDARVNCAFSHVTPSRHYFLTYVLPRPPAKTVSSPFTLTRTASAEVWALFFKDHTHLSSSLREQIVDLAGSASLQPQAKGTKAGHTAPNFSRVTTTPSPALWL